MNNVAIVNVINAKSTGKIALNLLEQFTLKGINATFYYGIGKKSTNNNQIRFNTRAEVQVHKLLSRLTGLQGFFSSFATRRMLLDMKKRGVETIILINPHAFYLNEKKFYSYIAKNNLRFIYIIPDEYAYLGKCAVNPPCSRYLTGEGKCPNIHLYPNSWFFDTCGIIMKRKLNCYKNLKRARFVGPEFVVNNLRKTYLGKYMQSSILDEAIDLSLYSPRDASKLKEVHNIGEDKVVILCIAPPYKGITYFKQVAERLRENDKYVFIHVGKDEIESHDNYIHVNFVEKNSDLAVYYSMADLFLFPSMADTMSNACLEALACGTPLLTFNISGMPYLMDKSVGTMVTPKSIDELTDVVSKIEKKTIETVSRCRQYAEKRYDISKYAERIIEIAEGIE